MTLATRLPRPRRTSGDTYHTRNDAAAAARDFFWGSTTVRGCAFQHLETQDTDHGLLGTYVTADVNGRLVLIDFDNFGRARIEQVD